MPRTRGLLSPNKFGKLPGFKPILTRAPQTPPLKKEFGPAIKITTTEDTLEERWRVWQESPETAGKGSGSILEFICYDWLIRHGQKAGTDFIYQDPFFGGRRVLGGTVVDFYMPQRYLAWNPAGLQYHRTSTVDRARDALQKYMLAQKGITLIYLFETDLLQRPEYTLQLAWQARQIAGKV